ncbi:MAG: hypothetical protein WDW38_001737 [Sanguina aurantia]
MTRWSSCVRVGQQIDIWHDCRWVEGLLVGTAAPATLDMPPLEPPFDGGASTCCAGASSVAAGPRDAPSGPSNSMVVRVVGDFHQSGTAQLTKRWSDIRPSCHYDAPSRGFTPYTKTTALPPMFAAFSITDIPSGPAVLSRAYVSRVEQLLRQRQGKPPSLKQKEDYLQKAGIELLFAYRLELSAIGLDAAAWWAGVTPLLLPMLGLTALPTAPTFLTHLNPDPDAVDLMCAGGTAAGQTRDGDGDEGGEDSGEEGTPWVPSTGRKRRRSAAAVGTGPRQPQVPHQEEQDPGHHGSPPPESEEAAPASPPHSHLPPVSPLMAGAAIHSAALPQSPPCYPAPASPPAAADPLASLPTAMSVAGPASRLARRVTSPLTHPSGGLSFTTEASPPPGQQQQQQSDAEADLPAHEGDAQPGSFFTHTVECLQSELNVQDGRSRADRWKGASAVHQDAIKAALSGLADSKWDLAAMADPCLEFAPAAIRAAEAKHEAFERRVQTMKDTAAASAVQTADQMRALLADGRALQDAAVPGLVVPGGEVAAAAAAAAAAAEGSISSHESVSELVRVKLEALETLSEAELWTGALEGFVIDVRAAEQQAGKGEWILRAWTVPLLLEVHGEAVREKLQLTRGSQPALGAAFVSAKVTATANAQASKARLRALADRKPGALGRA